MDDKHKLDEDELEEKSLCRIYVPCWIFEVEDKGEACKISYQIDFDTRVTTCIRFQDYSLIIPKED